jgi:hypothetical protein
VNLATTLLEALLTVGKIALIILPLTVLYQVLRDNPWINRTLGPHRGVLKGFGMGPAAMVSLMTGLILGIVYGAGILIQESRTGQMTRREVFLVALFLCTCHAVLEDTLLFVVVGGSAGWILGPRLVLALCATFLLARLLPREGSEVDSA